MPEVLAFVDDLMFVSRIRETARGLDVTVKTLRRVPELVESARGGAGLVLVDLDSTRLPVAEALAALHAEAGLEGLPVVGFFSHVHVERAKAAREAGCTRVLPRSAFVEQLPALLALAGTGAAG